MNRPLPSFLAVAALFLLACGSPDDEGGADASQEQQSDAGEEQGTDAGETDAGTEPAGDPNDQAVGTWTLTGAAACNLSFSGTWQGVRLPASRYGFRISKGQFETLECTIRATDTSEFTCADVNVGGPIAPGSQCTANYHFTNISGAFAGDAVDLTASIQVSSPNCGQALNCGPSTHNASGTVAR